MRGQGNEICLASLYYVACKTENTEIFGKYVHLERTLLKQRDIDRYVMIYGVLVRQKYRIPGYTWAYL